MVRLLEDWGVLCQPGSILTGDDFRFGEELAASGVRVLRGVQVRSHLEVLGTRLVVTVDAAGRLRNVRAHLRCDLDGMASPLSPEEARAALETASGGGWGACEQSSPADLCRAAPEGSPEMSSARRVVDPHRRVVSWLVSDGALRQLVDERTAEVRRSAPLAAGSTMAARIAYQDLEPVDRVDLEARVSCVHTGQAVCSCKLEYNDAEASTPTRWAIHQIENKNAPYHPVVDGVLCPGTTPEFVNVSDPQIYVQQHLYYWTYRARRYAAFNLFNSVTRADGSEPADARLGVKVVPSVSALDECFWLPSSAQGCFWGGTEPIIKIEFGGSRLPSAGLLFHEYGHYVTWLYGSFDPEAFLGGNGFNYCDNGHQGFNVWETAANLVQIILEQHFFDRTRGARLEHTAEPFGEQFVPGVAGCPPSNLYTMGRRLEGALLEILQDKNCNTLEVVDGALVHTSDCERCTSTADCSRGYCSDGYCASAQFDEIGWDDAADAEATMLNAVVYGIVNNSPGLTFEELAAGMVDWVELVKGDEMAGRVRDVLAHHALLSRPPRGGFVDRSARTIDGWACDPDTPGRAVRVDLQVWREDQQLWLPVGSAIADGDSSGETDVALRCEGGTAHRFSRGLDEGAFELLFRNGPFAYHDVRAVVHDTDTSYRQHQYRELGFASQVEVLGRLYIWKPEVVAAVVF